MTLGSEGWEQNRSRVGLAFLLLGVVLLVWAWVSWAYRTGTTVGTVAVVTQADEKLAREQAAKSLPALLLAGLLLVLVFFVGSLAMRRASRALREGDRRHGAGPTQAGDVWTTHQPPPLEEDETPKPNGQ